jgi:iron complex outermembrane receptor protein
LRIAIRKIFLTYLLLGIVGFSVLNAEDVPKQPTCGSDNCKSAENSPEKVPVRKEEIVVTGTFAPAPLEDIERAVSSISLRETTSIFATWVQALQDDSSLDLRQRGPDGTQADLSIRGSSFGQTLVLVNGLRVDDAQSGHHNLDLPLPLSALDRVEVLRGAGSTLYGSDAAGGAVNFITRPPNVSEFRLGTAVGNFGVNQQDASVAVVRGGLSEQLSFARDFSSGFMPDRDYRFLAFASDTHAKTALGNTGVLLAYGDRPFGADQFYGDYPSWERTKSWLALVHQELGNNTDVEFGFRRHTDLFDLFRYQPYIYENNHATLSWQAALRRHQNVSQNGTLAYGAEGYRDSIDSSNLGVHARNRGAVYVNYDMRALRRFSFSVGGREEVYNSTRSQFSPTAAAGFWLAQGLKLRASASRAFRLPTYTDLYYHDPATVGNPNLMPESAWSYEGGVEWDRGGRVRAGVTIFQRRDHNVIDYAECTTGASPLPTEIPCDSKWHALNVDNLHFTGAESSLTFRLPRANRIEFSYTALHGSQDALQALNSRYVFDHLRHDAIVGWQGILFGKLIARSRVGVAERYCASSLCASGQTGSSRGDPYALWDLALMRQFGYVSARVGFTNLTDTRYEQIQNVLMPGRSVVVGLELVVPKR